MADTYNGVTSPRANREGEIEILTPTQAATLLRAAEDHYPQAVASYALQLFAGIRVEEVTRLKAEHVTADGIELLTLALLSGMFRPSEIEGGIFIPGGGRHSRGAGCAKDAEKHLEAVLAGWTVIRLTEKQVELDFIERIAALLRQSSSSEETISGRNRRME